MSSQASGKSIVSDYNVLAIPSVIGDPFTCFDVQDEYGYLVTGTAIGQIALWRLDHLLSSNALQAMNEQEIEKEKQKDKEVICRIMSPNSEEGVRYVYFDDVQVFAVVGDLHLKLFASVHSASPHIIRFERNHNYQTCGNCYTLKSDHQVVLVNVGASDGVLVDTDKMRQTQFRLELPKGVIPCDFDGARFVYLEVDKEGDKAVKVFNVNDLKLKHELKFNKKKKHYWGFQLMGDEIVHVCCQKKLKIWNLNDLSQPVWKTVAHDERILAFEKSPDKQTIISLGADKKIKFWRNRSLVATYSNIQGTFRLGYPYALKQVGTRLFYSADEGIFVLQLTPEAV